MLNTFIAKTKLFQNLSVDQTNEIAQHLELRTYAKNKIVFNAGQPANNLFIIYHGRVKIFKLSADGKTHILHILKQGDIFAEAPMFSGTTYPAYCETLEETKLIALSRGKLMTIIKNNPEVAINMLAIQAKRLLKFANLVEDLSLKETSQRFAQYLLEQFAGQNEFNLDLSLTTLAEIIGSSRENISRILHSMIAGNIITKKDKKIILLDRNKLAEMV